MDYKIDRKSHAQASAEANNRLRHNKPSKDLLEAFYNNHSIDQCEAYYNVGQETIYMWLNEYSIPLKSRQTSLQLGKQRQYEGFQPSPDQVLEHYDGNIAITAQKLGKSYAYTRHLLHEYNIDIVNSKRSRIEHEICEFLTCCGVEFTTNNRDLIGPKELDIIIPSHKLAIEVCGVIWHSQTFGNKLPQYHQSKWKACEDVGYQLLTIFDSDWLNKQAIVKSVLLNKLKLLRPLYARKCEVIILEPYVACAFYATNHMMGAVGASIHLGLIYDEQLVAVMSFGRNRHGNEYQYEMMRFCTKQNVSVVGGTSKLLQHFIRNYDPISIGSFCDLRFGNGDGYLTIGFNESHITRPNYWYFKLSNTNQLFSRVKFQKHKLPQLLPIFDESLSEYQNMLNNKYDRIWDCGNRLFVWN